MATEVILPRVDMDMATGKISRWLVKPGEKVARGAVLFEIETDKAAMEIEAEQSGILDHIVAEEGVEIPVGQVVAWIFAEGEERVQPGSQPRPQMALESPMVGGLAGLVAEGPTAHSQLPEPVAIAPSDAGDIRATPLARRLARDGGLDLASVAGSGPHSRIQAADVERAIATQGPHTSAAGLKIQWRGVEQGPVVVLLHGFTADAGSWAPLFKALERDCRLLLIDLPGHGGSAHVEVTDFAALVEVVRGGLVAAGALSCHLVGHSLGGAVAAALAERIAAKSLTLICPAGLGPEINGAFLKGITAARQIEAYQVWLKVLVCDEALISDRFARTAWKAREEDGVFAVQERMAGLLAAGDTQLIDVRGLIAALDIPVRVISGLKDRIIPAAQSLALGGAVALHRLGEAGHMPQLEQPELTARLILETVASAS